MLRLKAEVADPPLDRLTNIGFRDAPGPLATKGVTEAAKLTVPTKLLRLVTVMVDAASWPAETLSGFGLEATLKSEKLPWQQA